MNKKHLIIISGSLIVFAIVSVLITYGMIQSTINKKIEAIQSGEMITSSGDGIEEIKTLKPSLGIDVNGTFNENSITWIEQAYQEGETQIEYYKISGLINKEVENKINEKLKKAAFQNFDATKIDKIRFHSYQQIYASFSNVISVRTNITISNISGRADSKNETNVLNIELVSGEEISFRDLFVDENAIAQIMAVRFHEEEAWFKQWEKETDPFDGGYEFNQELWDSPILNIDEDKIFKKVNSYKNLDYDYFEFTSQYVMVKIKLDSENVEYMQLQFDWAPYTIAVYDRYLTNKKIYEDESLGRKNIINLSYLEMHPCEYSVYENDKSTNYFAKVEVYLNMPNEEHSNKEKAKNEIVKLAKKELTELERKAQAEPDKYFVYAKEYVIRDYMPGEMFGVYETNSEYFTDISNKEKLYQEVVDFYTDEELYFLRNRFYIYKFR